jgi:hypothetical protein
VALAQRSSLAVTATVALRHVRPGDETGQSAPPEAEVETADAEWSLVGGADT